MIVASPGIAGQPFPAVFELSALNGEDGFSVDGIAENDVAGASVSAGTDINGDEIADLLIGAIGVDPEGLNGVGATYIVYGGASVGASGHVDLSTLNGITGCALYGLNEGDFSGSVSGVGDFNRDGFADVLIGASGGDPNRRFEAGQGYLVYGGPQIGVGGEFELADLNGLNGFNLNATHLLGHLGDGGSLSGVGDVNGDGYADVAIGAKWADPAGGADAGQSYVVFGGPTVGVDGNLLLTTLNGHNGFTLNGIAPGDNAGIALGYGGDVNGDGFSDLVVGAVNADPGGRDDAGQTYVVFGNSVPFPAQLELSSLDGSQGFAINGIQRLDHSGVVVNNVGDVNADGHEDIAIGAWRASPQGVFDAGQSYVIFGGPDIGASGTIELSDLNGSNGFMLDGVAEGDQSGSVASGRLDLNHDGVADLIIGAHRADPGGRTDAGSTYVVYGKAGLGASGLIELSELNGEDGFVLNGVTEEDFSAATAAPGGDLNNDGIDDLIIGAFNADPHAIEDAGQTYVVFGRAGDSDDDGIANNVDNCTKIANSDQRDSNSDGYGNACDPDLDNNGVTNFTDLGLLKAAFFGADPDADLTGDGQVNFGDLGVMKSLFLMPPGPSGFVE